MYGTHKKYYGIVRKKKTYSASLRYRLLHCSYVIFYLLYLRCWEDSSLRYSIDSIVSQTLQEKTKKNQIFDYLIQNIPQSKINKHSGTTHLFCALYSSYRGRHSVANVSLQVSIYSSIYCAEYIHCGWWWLHNWMYYK